MTPFGLPTPAPSFAGVGSAGDEEEIAGAFGSPSPLLLLSFGSGRRCSVEVAAASLWDGGASAKGETKMRSCGATRLRRGRGTRFKKKHHRPSSFVVSLVTAMDAGAGCLRRSGAQRLSNQHGELGIGRLALGVLGERAVEHRAADRASEAPSGEPAAATRVGAWGERARVCCLPVCSLLDALTGPQTEAA